MSNDPRPGATHTQAEAVIAQWQEIGREGVAAAAVVGEALQAMAAELGRIGLTQADVMPVQGPDAR